jgi:exodeoxyribonuclease VII large subunit
MTEGTRVVAWVKPDFYAARGSLTMSAFDVRPVGVGALLARIEQLRATLAAEGLFAPGRKRALPFLPRRVGLVTGRGSAAERDVVDNSRRRWAAVEFAIENVAVQGPYAVQEVVAAVQRLDADATVDVIVVARGGGSVEDLLPFSDEGLVRAVSACATPVVSAVGHESDVPLLDHVADRRASTPTDAAKLVVPDVAEETVRVATMRDRARRAVAARLDAEAHRLDGLRSRPALADPTSQLTRWAEEIERQRERARRAALACVGESAHEVARLAARVTALSPEATLRRGYAVLQRDGGAAVRSAADVRAGDTLSARLADGRITVTVDA